ncbi:hypothetical protein HMPREF0973_01472 [Prevotella veroralis F0319]|uniref:Uncharacterized protein n=1 Tax=Prevotella veroralis F0319 TaxID=649761 RepID=C9MPD4_9BACT|nr:hypothetical protein HMPREF0973_01472 [Prevotella veroralis F0319]
MMLQSRDRRPRLSAQSSLFIVVSYISMRTDEGVCPYFVIVFLYRRNMQVEKSSRTNSNRVRELFCVSLIG